jgi:hypothetical protein
LAGVLRFKVWSFRGHRRHHPGGKIHAGLV